MSTECEECGAIKDVYSYILEDRIAKLCNDCAKDLNCYMPRGAQKTRRYKESDHAGQESLEEYGLRIRDDHVQQMEEE
jgi:hypothetical protein